MLNEDRITKLCFFPNPSHCRRGMTRGQWRGNAFIAPESLTVDLHCVNATSSRFLMEFPDHH